MRNKKGITLIALVITIIVLLILAGVSLSLIAGENGILGRVTKAVDKTEIEGGKEEIELLVSDYGMKFYEDKYVNNTSNLGRIDDYIEERFNGLEQPTQGGYGATIANKHVQVNKNGKPIATGTLEEGKILWDAEVTIVSYITVTIFGDIYTLPSNYTFRDVIQKYPNMPQEKSGLGGMSSWNESCEVPAIHDNDSGSGENYYVKKSGVPIFKNEKLEDGEKYYVDRSGVCVLLNRKIVLL